MDDMYLLVGLGLELLRTPRHIVMPTS